MKTTKSAKKMGSCSKCGARCAIRLGWFGEEVVEFHGMVGGGRKGQGIHGRCPGSRRPPAEVGAERIAAYEAANDARVAAEMAQEV